MFMGKIKDWQESTTRPREHKHKTRFILAIQDGVPYVNKASPHDDSSPPWHYPCFVPDLRLHAPSGPGVVYARPHARHRRDKAGSNGHVPGGVEAGDPSRRTGGKRDYIGAIRLTQQAEDKFGRLAKSYPQWRPNLLQTRRQLNRENLDQWQKLAQQQAAASSSSGLELERPASVPKRPRPKPNIALPPGYKGVEFPTRPGESLINTIPSPSVSPGAAPEVVESNYERIRRLLDKTTMENNALIQALKRTRREQEEILAKLAVASAGESVYRDELLKVKKQMEDERKTSNKLIQTLTRRVEELEQNVTSLSQDKARYLAQIADLQLQLREYQDKLDKVTDEKNALQKDRDQLAALVELNSPDKTKNLLDRNLTLAAQLKDAQDKIAALETAKSDSEEQRKANLKALEEAREESADLKQKLIAIRDENIGYRKRITELNTKLINADVELSKLEANPEKARFFWKKTSCCAPPSPSSSAYFPCRTRAAPCSSALISGYIRKIRTRRK